MKNIRKLWQYSYHYKHCFLLLLLFVCLAAYAEIRIPQFMSDVLDDILASKPLSSIAQSCIVMGVFAVLLALEGVGEGYFVSRWAAGVTRNLSDKLFSRILSFESKDMDHFGSATFLTRLTTDITLLRRALEMVCNLLLCPLLIIFSVISAIQINHGLSLIFLLIIPILAGILLFIILRSRVFYRRMLINYDEMNQTLSESFRGMRTVKSYAREDRQQSVFRKIADHLRQNSVSAEKLAALNNPFSKMAVNLSVLALAWFGGFQVVQQDVTVGDLFCLISYANQILAQVLIISMILVPLITSMVSFSRILEVLEWDSGVQPQEHSEADCAPEDDHVAVSLKHVCFSYRKDNPGNPLLNDISFDIRRGEFLGIIGTGSAGKSTLIRLIMGLYQPDAGSLKLFGRDCGDYPREIRRSFFGYVPEPAQLFTGTIRENLCAGRESVDETELDEACRNACIDEFIQEQPEGYDTLLQEGGSNLSGGQRQRVNLARGLLNKAPILVMDNVTSALDRITEEKVVRNLRMNYADSTRIVVSDRITTIRDADRILVLDRGRIAGLGTHGELLDSCPLYAEMAQTQKGQIADV